MPCAGSTTTGNAFNDFLGGGASVPIQNQRWASAARSPLGGLTYPQQQPFAHSNVVSGTDGHVTSANVAVTDAKPAATTPAAQVDSPVESAPEHAE